VNNLRIELDEGQRLWLRRVCAKLRNGETVTARKLRVELQDKLPRDFDAFQIDYRLLRDGVKVTVLGLALFDPANPRVKTANQVIAAVYDLLNRFPDVEVVGIDEIARATSSPKVEIAVLFRELAELGTFHSSGSTYGHGIDGWATIRVDKNAFEAYMNYRDLDQVLDTFLDERTLASSPAEANVQEFLQSIRQLKDGLTPVWIKAIDEEDLNGATDDLEDWRKRLVAYLREQLSDVEAVEFQTITKSFPLVHSVGDLEFRISRYEQWLSDLAKQVQQDPNRLASSRFKPIAGDNKKPQFEAGLEHAHFLYEKAKTLIDRSLNLDETTARVIVETVDDAIKEFGSKHQEKKIELKEWRRRAELVLPPETLEELRKRAESGFFKRFFPQNSRLRAVFIVIVFVIIVLVGILTAKKLLLGDSPVWPKSPSSLPQNQIDQPRNEGRVDKSSEIPSPNVNSKQSTPNNAPIDRQELSVAEGSTESFFGGDVLISLIQTSLEGEPLRQKVFANVGSPRGHDFKIDRKDIGFSFYYTGKAKYQIRITGAETFYAKFLVVRTNDSGR
jgi:hypothetical protein